MYLLEFFIGSTVIIVHRCSAQGVCQTLLTARNVAYPHIVSTNIEDHFMKSQGGLLLMAWRAYDLAQSQHFCHRCTDEICNKQKQLLTFRFQLMRTFFDALSTNFCSRSLCVSSPAMITSSIMTPAPSRSSTIWSMVL